MWRFISILIYSPSLILHSVVSVAPLCWVLHRAPTLYLDHLQHTDCAKTKKLIDFQMIIIKALRMDI